MTSRCLLLRLLSSASSKNCLYLQSVLILIFRLMHRPLLGPPIQVDEVNWRLDFFCLPFEIRLLLDSFSSCDESSESLSLSVLLSLSRTCICVICICGICIWHICACGIIIIGCAICCVACGIIIIGCPGIMSICPGKRALFLRPIQSWPSGSRTCPASS